MAKDLDHRVAITLICQHCGTEWVPRYSSLGGSMKDSPTRHYSAAVAVDGNDTECPVCNALDQAVAQAKQARERRMSH